MNSISAVIFSVYAIALCVVVPVTSNAQEKKAKSCCIKPKTSTDNETSTIEQKQIIIPNVDLINQEGKQINLRQLTKGKVVAINFIFTKCTTICPVMGVQFSSLTKKMRQNLGKELVMISISIDPVNDTPERLNAWSKKFEPIQGWNLLTGNKHVIDNLLKELEVFTALKEEHAPIILMGIEGTGDWVRTNGLTAPDDLAIHLNKYLETSSNNTSTKAEKKGASSYFTNIPLVNQYGEEMALYDDLMRDKVVVINPFFAECTGTCPVMNSRMEALQEHLGDRLGKDVFILSITVDPKNDTPNSLAAYADRFHAKRGWYFLSGEISNVEAALHKFGKYVENREAHDTILLIGNVTTKLWKKANGLSEPKDIIKIVDSVIEDEGQKS